MLSAAFYHLTCIIIYVPTRYKDIINNGLKTQDDTKIKEAKYISVYFSLKFMRLMRIRYICYIALTGVLSILSFYYMIVFCAIYPYSSIEWAITGLFCVILKVGVSEMIGPLVGGILRKFDKDRERYFYFYF
jgi:hypothetical protein